MPVDFLEPNDSVGWQCTKMEFIFLQLLFATVIKFINFLIYVNKH